MTKMDGQFALFECFGNPRRRVDNQRRRWENGFQRWSDKAHTDEPTTHYGKCGYGVMCDCCEDNSFGRPCVRALNAMCRDSLITIDYAKMSYEDVWDGRFGNDG